MDLAITLPASIIVASVILALAILAAARMMAKAPRPQAGPSSSVAGFVPPTMHMPMSEEGFPVEPSGIPVQPETRLEVGSTVLAFSQDRWWRAEVVALVGRDMVRIHYPGWEAEWDETVPRGELQVDLGSSLK